MKYSIKTGQYSDSTGRRMTKVRVFLYTTEDSLLKRLFGHSAPYKTYRTEILPKVFEKLKISPRRVSWSKVAGCACGCSPGYVLDIDPAEVGYEAIWVTISGSKSRKLKD